MTEHISIRARRMRECDLEYVLAWRNHYHVRRFMLTQHEITVTEHRAWFDRASKDETRALLVIEEHNQPLGCVIFSGAQPNSTAEWSFYAAPTSPSGTGSRICSTALDFVFQELGVHKVTGQVLDFNRASIRIHQRLGFTQEGIQGEHCSIDGIYHDLLFFGILQKNWKNNIFNESGLHNNESFSINSIKPNSVIIK